MNAIKILVLLIVFTSCSTHKENLASTNAIYNLAVRTIGKDHANKFIFEKTGSNSKNDEFEINNVDDKIHIKGNSNIALASGLNWYLKYHTNSQISWDSERINIPKKFSALDSIIVKESPFTYSYYLNYCTFNYTMAFWDWERWEKEIDWMALNGINLPLAIVGMEYVWKNTLERLDFSETEINQFIPGPGFNAWWHMGNLEGWGGPLSDGYLEQQVTLQKKILARMKALDMHPVLPGFYGMVPNTLKNKYPKADIRDQGLWAGGFKRPAFLSPTDSLFSTISKIYYEELEKTFGAITYFSGDPFHEGGSTQGINLPEAGKNIIYGMRESFPNSTWVFQGWQGNPNENLLRDIKNEDVLILDLDCDNYPQWEARNGWNQRPWIWNTINNYGGNKGLFGRMDVIAEEPFRALAYSEDSQNLKGVGAMMEGIENNYVMYDLLFELKWHHSKIDLDSWLANYTSRRYGKTNDNLNKAWQILRRTVYGKTLDPSKRQQGTSESILCARPNLDINQVSSWGTTQLYYNPSEILEAWTLFTNEAEQFKNNDGFQYDLLELTRQVLANFGQVLYAEVLSAYKNNDQVAFKKTSNEFLQLITDQDLLLSSHENFMLGKWIADARDRGTNDTEKDLFEYNARVQITTWSFQNSDLHEYAHKEWSGMLTDFYQPRWQLFFDYLNQKLENKDTQEPNYYAFEENWTKQTKKYPTKILHNPLTESLKVYEKYFTKIRSGYLN